MEAKIEKVEWELKSIPQTIEVKDSEISFSPTNVDMIEYDGNLILQPLTIWLKHIDIKHFVLYWLTNFAQ